MEIFYVEKRVKDFISNLEVGTELAPVPTRADLSPMASNSMNKSISKTNEK